MSDTHSCANAPAMTEAVGSGNKKDRDVGQS
jgi:hypothetical protein